MSDEQHGERVPGWQAESIWRRGEEPEFGRFAFFTDAVFAIALTILVLDIRLPRDVGQEPGDMWNALGDVQPQVVAFGVAFILLSRYWLAHHGFVSTLTAVSGRLMALNLVYLAFVAFLPFPTSLVGGHEDNPVSVILFALTMAVVSAMETVLFVSAHRQGLIRHQIGRAHV